MSTAAFETKIRSPQAQGASAPIAAILPVNGRRGATPSRTAAPDSESIRLLVISIIHRIEIYLDEETTALDKATEFDFKTSNDRKSQGLLDLNQAVRRLQQSDVNPDLQKRLMAFREKLAVNLRKIRLHLDAVKEIAAMLSEAIQNADSDGTYTRNIGPYRNAL